jgi:hypothetical protein
VEKLVCLGVRGMGNEIEHFSFISDMFPCNSRMPSESHAKIASLPLPYTVFTVQS